LAIGASFRFWVEPYWSTRWPCCQEPFFTSGHTGRLLSGPSSGGCVPFVGDRSAHCPEVGATLRLRSGQARRVATVVRPQNGGRPCSPAQSMAHWRNQAGSPKPPRLTCEPRQRGIRRVPRARGATPEAARRVPPVSSWAGGVQLWCILKGCVLSGVPVIQLSDNNLDSGGCRAVAWLCACGCNFHLDRILLSWQPGWLRKGC